MVEMKSEMVVAREQIRDVLDSMFAMRDIGGVLPFTVLSTLLGSQDLTDEQIKGFNMRGDLQISQDMKFVNEREHETVIEGVKLPGVHGTTNLHIAPLVVGRFDEVTNDRLVMTFVEGFTGKTMVKGIQMGGGRYFAFEVDEKSILIKTKGVEPAVMKGVSIDVRIWVGEKPEKKKAPKVAAAEPANPAEQAS